MVAEHSTFLGSRTEVPVAPSFIELFAGAGLFSHAFIKEGFAPLMAVELCEQAATTYQRNLGGHIVCGDVTRLSPPSRCDLIVAGPPCQGFSTLGKRNPKDPRNKLSLDVLRWTKATDAKVVVIENVAAFLDSEQWKILRRRFLANGYEFASFVLNAHDFGVPQLRRRSFTIASRIGLPATIIPVAEGAATVREAFKGLSPIPLETGLHRARPISELALSRIRAIPAGGDKRDILKRGRAGVPESWHLVGCQATDVWGRMAWDQPSNTLRTCFINPSKGRYLHPQQDRAITFQEAMRLHSIPDGWEFVGNDSSIARQIGNSVPPLLGQAIARAVRQLPF